MAVSRVAIQASTSQLPAGLILADANGLLASAEPRFKVGSVSHDISVTGSQAVTGIGFKPTAIIIFANIDSTNVASWGYSDGTTKMALAYSSVVNQFRNSSTVLVYLISTVGVNEAYANLSSFDSDGFTLSWTKSGSPTGTTAVMYIALR